MAEYTNLKEGCAKAKKELEDKGPECTITLKNYESQKHNCDSVQDAMDSLSCSTMRRRPASARLLERAMTSLSPITSLSRLRPDPATLLEEGVARHLAHGVHHSGLQSRLVQTGQRH